MWRRVRETLSLLDRLVHGCPGDVRGKRSRPFLGYGATCAEARRPAEGAPNVLIDVSPEVA